MITVLHRGGMPKWLQYYIGGGVSRDPQKWLRNMCTTPYCKWLQHSTKGGGSLGSSKSDYVDISENQTNANPNLGHPFSKMMRSYPASIYIPSPNAQMYRENIFHWVSKVACGLYFIYSRIFKSEISQGFQCEIHQGVLGCAFVCASSVHLWS